MCEAVMSHLPVKRKTAIDWMLEFEVTAVRMRCPYYGSLSCDRGLDSRGLLWSSRKVYLVPTTVNDAESIKTSTCWC